MDLRKGFPIAEWLPEYNKKTFRSDLIAGITVAILLVPQGMAYAFLAGMPPIYGLYGGLIPLFIYALFSTSRQMSIGPVAISALLVLAGVSQLAEPASAEYVQLVITAGLMIGILQVVLCFLSLGFLVNFLSHPVVVGFTSAAAVIIAISQLKDLLGIPIPRFPHTYDTLIYAIDNIKQTNLISVVICIGGIALILILKAINTKIPGALITVIIGTLLTWKFDLAAHGLDLVGTVPEGLPGFMMPDLTLSTLKSLLPTVVTVTIIGVVESLGIAKVLEAKHQSYTVRPNQELLALGLAKIGGAFFQSLPTSGSFTRSAINNDSGAKTGMASIISASIVGLTLLFFTPLFFYLPKAVLASIILLAVKSLFDFKEAMHLWHTHRQDFAMMLITFIATLTFGIEEGVFAGVLLSILAVLYWSSNPHIAELGNLPGTSYYRNIERFENANPSNDMLIIRFDDQLFFGNASAFKDNIKSLIEDRTTKVNHLIIDCSSIHSIDSTGIHALEEIFNFLQKKNVSLNMSGVIGPVRDQLFKSGIIQLVGQKQQFMKVHDAVQYIKGQEHPDSVWTQDALQTNIEEQE